MRKRKVEKHHWIAFPTREAEVKGLELLLQGGRVHSLDFGYGIIGMTASESQLQQLTQEGIPWDFAAKVGEQRREAEGDGSKPQSIKPTVRTTAYRRRERAA